MFIGVDLGTSGIKVILMNETGEILDTKSEALTVSRPQPLWSEQNPSEWWAAFEAVMDFFSDKYDLKKVSAIGISGQMHGATLLDSNNEIIRPAILWNDGRCEAQCKEIEQKVPSSRDITGNIMMPGFTAPKLLWVKQYEPEAFSRIAKVLLPKDYLRLLLSGDFASEMSDAAGTMWLDVANRNWSDELLKVCGLTTAQMPKLYEGNQITGHLLASLARRWGMLCVPIIAGAGDNAGGAVGVGIVEPGQGMISLGTSGVYFLVSDGVQANPESAVHCFCHALPDRWHLMSVMLSAASCLQWFSEDIVGKPVKELLQELETANNQLIEGPFFLPYLSGERTPHNNPHATGNFFGLTHSTDRKAMTHAVLEGVSFAFADGVDAVHASGAKATEITLIGGGAKSQYWRQMLADVLDTKITFRSGGDVGPALGAARLAQLAMNPHASISEICPSPELVEVHIPNPETAEIYRRRRPTFISLYKQLQSLF